MAKSARLPSSLLPAIALFLAIALSLALPAIARAASDIPPAPAQFFNDYDNKVDPEVAQQLNTQLANFERQTSNQIVVAVYPSLDPNEALDDYCYRVASAWKVGQASHDNGAVLFVFVNNHKMRIQTGTGLEGALPDILCAQIMDDTIAPRFKQGDYTGGLRDGVNAIIAATRHEYQGTGTTNYDRTHRSAPGDNTVNVSGGGFPFIFFLFILFIIISTIFRSTRGYGYSSSGIGRYGGFMLGNAIGSAIGSSIGSSFSSGGGGGGGGGFSGGGGGGGFSGGGGSFGGGGASGSW